MRGPKSDDEVSSPGGSGSGSQSPAQSANSSHSQGQSQSQRQNPPAAFTRTYKACLNCRQRKVKCIFADTDPPSTRCSRCTRENRKCVVPEQSRRGGIRNVLAGKARRQREELIRQQLNSSRNDVWKQRELYNSADALHLLSQLARSMPRDTEAANPNGTGSGPNMGMSAAAGAQRVAPGPTAIGQSADWNRFPSGETIPLGQIELIKVLQVISAEEARLLVNYFVKHMGPYYPFVPPEYNTADKIAAMPLLLATITCLAVRYYVPENLSAVVETQLYEKRGQTHIALWEYCQRLLSQTVWTEASPRSVSTVISFLLFTEWSPTAVHARQRDYASIGGPEPQKTDDWLGLGASRRSDRMSWLMLGSAVRLAQDIGLMDGSPSLYVAMHTSEIVLACRLGRSPMLNKFVHDPLPEHLSFTREQIAQIEVLQIMALANETLYPSRAATRELVKSGRYIFLMNILAPYLDTWQEKYHDMLEGDSIFTEDIIFGFNHTRLYIFSLALLPTDGGASVANLAVLRPSARYVAMAIDAAKKVVGAATRLHARGQLKFMPIRWVMRLIHAIVFLVKGLLLTMPVFQQETPQQIIKMIREASQILLSVGPDRYHICRHYGSVILNLCAQFSRETVTPEPSEPTPAGTGPPTDPLAHIPDSPASILIPSQGLQGQSESQSQNHSQGQSPNIGATQDETSPFSKINPVPMFHLPDGPVLTTDDTMTFGMDIDFLLGNEHFDFDGGLEFGVFGSRDM